jgi:hypothetical protein
VGHAAAFDNRLGSTLAGGAGYRIVRKLRWHGYELVKNAEGFILNDAFGPLRASEIERAKECGAQVVRRSVANPEGCAIWDRLVIGPGSPTCGGRSPVTSDRISISRGAAVTAQLACLDRYDSCTENTADTCWCLPSRR